MANDNIITWRASKVLPFLSIDDIKYPFEITPETLKKEETVGDFEYLTLDCLHSGEPGPALELLRILKEAAVRAPGLRIENSGLFDRYETVKAILMLAGLPMLPDVDVQEFCMKYLLRVLRASAVQYLEYDLRNRFEFRISFAATVNFGHRQERENLIRAFQQNEERLGEVSITAAGASGAHPPVLGNWFKDYDAFFPSFTLRGVLHRTRYISESGGARRLNEEERQLLFKALEIYDFVRFPAVAIKEMGRQLPKEEVEAEPQGNVAPVRLTGKELLAEIERMLEIAASEVQIKTRGNTQEIVRTLYDNLLPPPGISYHRNFVLGSLVLLARSGWVLRLLSEQNPIRDRFEEYLKREGAPQDLETFRLAPVSPLSVGKFLRFVLQRRMMVNEEEAAKVAIKIGNLLKQAGKGEYLGMAYFDQTSGQFRWKA